MDYEWLSITHCAKTFLDQQRKNIAHHLWRFAIFYVQRLTDRIRYQRRAACAHQHRTSFRNFAPNHPNDVSGNSRGRINDDPVARVPVYSYGLPNKVFREGIAAPTVHFTL
jgi:hypothetical protein